jgi:hypothetical protein
MLLWATACTQPEPTPFPTAGTEASPSADDVPTDDVPADEAPADEAPQEEDRQSYESPDGLFQIELPASWAVEERGLTSLGQQFALGPEPLGPGPGTSFLYVAGADVSPEAAAEQLLCGNGCADEIELEETTVAGQSAFRALLGASPQLEWYFVPHGNRLIFFSIHDPSTFATREDLVETLVLEEAGTPEPTVTPTPAPTETPTPMPEVTIEAVREWQVVTVEDAGLTFEVPAQWEEGGDYRWTPEDSSSLALGFQWTQHGPAAPLAGILPADVELLDSEPISITWGSRISTTVQTNAGLLQRHLITQVGLRTYDFHSEAPTTQALDALDPLLQDVVNSMTITERLLFYDDPVNAGIEFFRELLRDPASATTHSYLSNELQAQLGENPDATALLNLSQPFHTFNLDWVTGSEEQAILEATLTLSDDSTVVRNVHLIFDETIGWRIDGFEEGEQPADEGEE